MGRLLLAVMSLERSRWNSLQSRGWLKAEPWMDPLGVDARYTDLLKRAGFPN